MTQNSSSSKNNDKYELRRVLALGIKDTDYLTSEGND